MILKGIDDDGVVAPGTNLGKDIQAYPEGTHAPYPPDHAAATRGQTYWTIGPPLRRMDVVLFVPHAAGRGLLYFMAEGRRRRQP